MVMATADPNASPTAGPGTAQDSHQAPEPDSFLHDQSVPMAAEVGAQTSGGAVPSAQVAVQAPAADKDEDCDHDGTDSPPPQDSASVHAHGRVTRAATMLARFPVGARPKPVSKAGSARPAGVSVGVKRVAPSDDSRDVPASDHKESSESGASTNDATDTDSEWSSDIEEDSTPVRRRRRKPVQRPPRKRVQSEGGAGGTGRSQRYTGVYNQGAGRWRAQFCHGGLVHQLGMYASEAGAAQAWDRVSWVYRGKAGDLNFPELVTEYDTQESKRTVHEQMDERMAMHKHRGRNGSPASKDGDKNGTSGKGHSNKDGADKKGGKKGSETGHVGGRGRAGVVRKLPNKFIPAVHDEPSDVPTGTHTKPGDGTAGAHREALPGHDSDTPSPAGSPGSGRPQRARRPPKRVHSDAFVCSLSSDDDSSERTVTDEGASPESHDDGATAALALRAGVVARPGRGALHGPGLPKARGGSAAATRMPHAAPGRWAGPGSGAEVAPLPSPGPGARPGRLSLEHLEEAAMMLEAREALVKQRTAGGVPAREPEVQLASQGTGQGKGARKRVRSASREPTPTPAAPADGAVGLAGSATPGSGALNHRPPERCRKKGARGSPVARAKHTPPSPVGALAGDALQAARSAAHGPDAATAPVEGVAAPRGRGTATARAATTAKAAPAARRAASADGEVPVSGREPATAGNGAVRRAGPNARAAQAASAHRTTPAATGLTVRPTQASNNNSNTTSAALPGPAASQSVFGSPPVGMRTVRSVLNLQPNGADTAAAVAKQHPALPPLSTRMSAALNNSLHSAGVRTAGQGMGPSAADLLASNPALVHMLGGLMGAAGQGAQVGASLAGGIGGAGPKHPPKGAVTSGPARLGQAPTGQQGSRPSVVGSHAGTVLTLPKNGTGSTANPGHVHSPHAHTGGLLGEVPSPDFLAALFGLPEWPPGPHPPPPGSAHAIGDGRLSVDGEHEVGHGGSERWPSAPAGWPGGDTSGCTRSLPTPPPLVLNAAAHPGTRAPPGLPPASAVPPHFPRGAQAAPVLDLTSASARGTGAAGSAAPGLGLADLLQPLFPPLSSRAPPAPGFLPLFPGSLAPNSAATAPAAAAAGHGANHNSTVLQLPCAHADAHATRAGGAGRRTAGMAAEGTGLSTPFGSDPDFERLLAHVMASTADTAVQGVAASKKAGKKGAGRAALRQPMQAGPGTSAGQDKGRGRAARRSVSPPPPVRMPTTSMAVQAGLGVGAAAGAGLPRSVQYMRGLDSEATGAASACTQSRQITTAVLGQGTGAAHGMGLGLGCGTHTAISSLPLGCGRTGTAPGEQVAHGAADGVAGACTRARSAHGGQRGGGHAALGGHGVSAGYGGGAPRGALAGQMPAVSGGGFAAPLPTTPLATLAAVPFGMDPCDSDLPFRLRGLTGSAQLGDREDGGGTTDTTGYPSSSRHLPPVFASEGLTSLDPVGSPTSLTGLLQLLRSPGLVSGVLTSPGVPITGLSLAPASGPLPQPSPLPLPPGASGMDGGVRHTPTVPPPFINA